MQEYGHLQQLHADQWNGIIFRNYVPMHLSFDQLGSCQVLGYRKTALTCYFWIKISEMTPWSANESPVKRFFGNLDGWFGDNCINYESLFHIHRCGYIIVIGSYNFIHLIFVVQKTLLQELKFHCQTPNIFYMSKKFIFCLCKKGT